MPAALRAELDGMETWALANEAAANSDSRKFWALKLPAIVLSAAGAMLSYFRYPDAAMVAVSVGGVLVLLDGIVRPGIMRNARYLGFYESRELQASINAKWAAAALRQPGAAAATAANLIEELSNERRRISQALKLVEANQATS